MLAEYRMIPFKSFTGKLLPMYHIPGAGKVEGRRLHVLLEQNQAEIKARLNEEIERWHDKDATKKEMVYHARGTIEMMDNLEEIDKKN